MQWQALEGASEPTGAGRLLLRLRRPRQSADEALAALDAQRRSSARAHAAAAARAQDRAGTQAELERKLANYADEVAHCERMVERHAALTAELRAMYAQVFAGADTDAHEAELRDARDVAAARSVEVRPHTCGR